MHCTDEIHRACRLDAAHNFLVQHEVRRSSPQAAPRSWQSANRLKSPVFVWSPTALAVLLRDIRSHPWRAHNPRISQRQMCPAGQFEEHFGKMVANPALAYMAFAFDSAY